MIIKFIFLKFSAPKILNKFFLANTKHVFGNFQIINNLNICKKTKNNHFDMKFWNFFYTFNAYNVLKISKLCNTVKTIPSGIYKIPVFFKKYFNMSNYLVSFLEQSMLLLYFKFIWEDISQNLKYLFLYTSIKNHRYLFLFLKFVFSQKIFSKKLIFLSVLLKGKFSVYGDARKRRLSYKLGPYYSIVHPRVGVNTYFGVKTHYFFIRTTTGLTSFVGFIKHIR